MSSMTATVVRTDLPLGPPLRGKVRDCYRFTSPVHGESLLIVSTDRISAFDWVLPTPIPDKGKVLTAISAFWFDLLAHGRSHVEGAHLSPQPAGCADGRESGHARADDQHPRRTGLARGRDLSREESAEVVRGFDDGAITGDIRHRRQRIHLLRA